MQEREVNIDNLSRLVALKKDFDYVSSEVVPVTDENAYFMVLLNLQNMGYSLSELMQFQEIQDLL